MTQPEVELLARQVVVERGLPFALVSVAASPTGWTVKYRSNSGGMVQLNVFGSRAVSMRTDIQEKLEELF